MIYHAAPLERWLADPERPYAPPTLHKDGSVHCSPSTEALLASVTRFLSGVEGPLVALLIDEARLDAPVSWEEPAAAAPSGAPAVPMPRIRGPVNRGAVVDVLEIARDDDGRARELLRR